MSPGVFQDIPEHWSFPRVSGDEPTRVSTPTFQPTFSPRERG